MQYRTNWGRRTGSSRLRYGSSGRWQVCTKDADKILLKGKNLRLDDYFRSINCLIIFIAFILWEEELQSISLFFFFRYGTKIQNKNEGLIMKSHSMGTWLIPDQWLYYMYGNTLTYKSYNSFVVGFFLSCSGLERGALPMKRQKDGNFKNTKSFKIASGYST